MFIFILPSVGFEDNNAKLKLLRNWYISQNILLLLFSLVIEFKRNSLKELYLFIFSNNWVIFFFILFSVSSLITVNFTSFTFLLFESIIFSLFLSLLLFSSLFPFFILFSLLIILLFIFSLILFSVYLYSILYGLEHIISFICCSNLSATGLSTAFLNLFIYFWK